MFNSDSRLKDCRKKRGRKEWDRDSKNAVGMGQ